MERVHSRRKISSQDGCTSPEKRFAPYRMPPPSPSSSSGYTPTKREEDERTLGNNAPKIAAHSSPAMKAMKTTKTAAERAREQSILNDPLANLLSPYYVECLQCKKQIKLSAKSAYDTFHWRNHRKRCVKTFKKKGKTVKSPVTSLPSPMDTSSSTTTLTPPQSPSVPTSDSNRERMTPPLISDEEDQQSERSSEVQSPMLASSSLPAIHSTPSITYYDYNVEDNLGRSHPGYVPRHSTRHLSCTSASTGSHSWSWSQLKPSRFAIEAARYDQSGSIDDDSSSDHSSSLSPGDERVQEAARTLSLLSRAR